MLFYCFSALIAKILENILIYVSSLIFFLLFLEFKVTEANASIYSGLIFNF